MEQHSGILAVRFHSFHIPSSIKVSISCSTEKFHLNLTLSFSYKAPRVLRIESYFPVQKNRLVSAKLVRSKCKLTVGSFVCIPLNEQLDHSSCPYLLRPFLIPSLGFRHLAILIPLFTLRMLEAIGITSWHLNQMLHLICLFLYYTPHPTIKLICCVN